MTASVGLRIFGFPDVGEGVHNPFRNRCRWIGSAMPLRDMRTSSQMTSAKSIFLDQSIAEHGCVSCVIETTDTILNPVCLGRQE